MQFRLRTLLIVLAIAPVLLSLPFATFPWSPSRSTLGPRSITIAALTETQQRIERYIATHEEYPANLSALPRRAGYWNSVTDGWGGPLIYAVPSDGTIELTSMGRDGKRGGSGEDADISRSFKAHRNNDIPSAEELWSEVVRGGSATLP